MVRRLRIVHLGLVAASKASSTLVSGSDWQRLITAATAALADASSADSEPARPNA
jgi:hypothetical protein